MLTVLMLHSKLKFVVFWQYKNRGRILGRNPVESMKSFPPCYSQSHLQLCLEISISSKSHNLLQFCKGDSRGKPDRKPYPLSYVLRNPYRNLQVWELSRLCPEHLKLNCTFMHSASGYTFLSFLWKTGFSQKHKIYFQLQNVYCVQHLLIINACNTIHYKLLYFACFIRSSAHIQ
jgi:hypothetical protein